MRGFSLNSQNIILDIVRKREEKQKKALKAADPKNKRFNRDIFENREEVIVQDPITKKWEKRGKIKSSRPTNTGHGARSYIIETDDGKTYMRKTRFLTRPAKAEE